jgi:hypothetical protein
MDGPRRCCAGDRGQRIGGDCGGGITGGPVGKSAQPRDMDVRRELQERR